jgi:hypothetical protein
MNRLSNNPDEDINKNRNRNFESSIKINLEDMIKFHKNENGFEID